MQNKQLLNGQVVSPAHLPINWRSDGPRYECTKKQSAESLLTEGGEEKRGEEERSSGEKERKSERGIREQRKGVKKE